MIIRLEQCMGGGGWLSYDERRRNPATREILMPPPRRMVRKLNMTPDQFYSFFKQIS